jgi:hypothetical protein
MRNEHIGSKGETLLLLLQRETGGKFSEPLFIYKTLYIRNKYTYTL